MDFRTWWRLFGLLLMASMWSYADVVRYYLATQTTTDRPVIEADCPEDPNEVGGWSPVEPCEDC
jgi:hypothetical protein